MEEEAGRFLARWSKRKAAARAGGDDGGKDLKDHKSAAVVAPEAGEEMQAELPAEQPAELPDIETLGAGSDFKPFMGEGVSAETRKAALRKLWGSNPLYNHIDMLDDYCEDYTDAACAAPGVRTLWKVGKGFVEELTSGEEAVTGQDATGEVATPESSKADILADRTGSSGSDGSVT